MGIFGIVLVLLFLITMIFYRKIHSDVSKNVVLLLVILILLYVGLLAFALPWITLTALVVYLSYVYIEGRKNFRDVKITTVYMESDELSEDFTLVFLADFQFDKSPKIINEEAFTAIVRKTNEIDFDMLLLGGDYVNFAENEPEYIEQFSKFKNAKLGKYAVLGNHDYVCLDKLKEDLPKVGIELVENKKIDINEEITVCGVEDEWYGNPKLPQLQEERLNILLAHNPDFIDRIKDEKHNIDLMLAGHYHGGGLNLLGIPVQRIITKYVYGLFTDNNMHTYVTSGVGGSILRGRFGMWIRYKAQPEIVVVKYYGLKNK